MMRLPLEAVLKWPRPNFENPQTRGQVGLIVGTTLLTFVTVLLAVRIFTRQYISKGLGLDDILIVLAYIPAIIFAVIAMVAQSHLGWNKHIWDVHEEFFVPSLKASLAVFILFDLASTVTKLSILAMIHRLTVASDDKWTNRCVLIMAGLVCVNGFIFVVVTLFQCRPVSEYWTVSLEPQNCINDDVHLLVAGTINTAEDFTLVFLPIRTVMRLELRRKEKLIVMGLFGAGLLVSCAGIARIYLTWIFATTPDFDLTWTGWDVVLASNVELFLGITCASLPAIKPFFAQYLPQVIGQTFRTHKSNNDMRYSKDVKLVQLLDPELAYVRTPSPASSTFPPNRPYPSHYHHGMRSTGLNTPRPSASDEGQSSSPMFSEDHHTSLVSEDASVYTERFSRPPQRAGVRFSNRSITPYPTDAGNPDRQTVVIMFQDDEEMGGRSTES
ncbi:uncharacterized protein BCR38DRAFT_228272 [Pseudomassariella vexata]|uniref:Rhodopsin domain-containing protein n=1 Tax=Pseudomassariella vexata TaxID=1141098 RepID=A0A1Y2DVX6_9PEZI|nr:uncharacterized protein BCR38DRAFT_228272 [Pseudomassariella vexata]ORY63431.1 hypothetical protein BCR38DRAFT_228272 [Pseudomassariella vexata]